MAKLRYWKTLISLIDTCNKFGVYSLSCFSRKAVSTLSSIWASRSYSKTCAYSWRGDTNSLASHHIGNRLYLRSLRYELKIRCETRKTVLGELDALGILGVKNVFC